VGRPSHDAVLGDKLLEMKNILFQQDGATAHTANNVINFLRGKFWGQHGDIAYLTSLFATFFFEAASNQKCMQTNPVYTGRFKRSHKTSD
jgi:hypothetical protein